MVYVKEFLHVLVDLLLLHLIEGQTSCNLPLCSPRGHGATISGFLSHLAKKSIRQFAKTPAQDPMPTRIGHKYNLLKAAPHFLSYQAT